MVSEGAQKRSAAQAPSFRSRFLVASSRARRLEPLALNFGRRRNRTGLVARRSAEDLAPLRLFEEIVHEIALEGPR